MSARLVSDLHRVGGGFAVRFALNGARLDVEWHPRLPAKRELRRVMDRYREARNQFAAEVGARLGGDVVVVELAP